MFSDSESTGGSSESRSITLSFCLSFKFPHLSHSAAVFLLTYLTLHSLSLLLCAVWCWDHPLSFSVQLLSFFFSFLAVLFGSFSNLLCCIVYYPGPWRYFRVCYLFLLAEPAYLFRNLCVMISVYAGSHSMPCFFLCLVVSDSVLVLAQEKWSVAFLKAWDESACVPAKKFCVCSCWIPGTLPRSWPQAPRPITLLLWASRAFCLASAFPSCFT